MKFHNNSTEIKVTKVPPKKGDTVRLNKFLSNAGLCSRREADEHIATGLVHVNGKVMTEMGYQVKLMVQEFKKPLLYIYYSISQKVLWLPHNLELQVNQYRS
jgi:ribosomal protein S4